MIRTFVARSAGELDCLRPLWTALEESTPCTVFQHFEWNRLAAAAFADREAPWVVCCESDSGAAIVPAAVRLADRTLTFLGEALFDYREALVVGDLLPLRVAWGHLGELALPFEAVAVRGAPRADCWPEASYSSYGEAFCVRASEIREEEFASSHRRLGRLWCRLQREGARLCCRSGSESDLVRWIYRAKAAQFAGSSGNLFADEPRVEFLAQCLAAQPGRCEIFTVEVESRVLAALVTLREQSWRRFYTIYYDRDWARHSPGSALLYEITRRSLAQGLECDYMTGQQGYKQRLASSSVPLFRMQASAEALHGLAEEAARVAQPAPVTA